MNPLQWPLHESGAQSGGETSPAVDGIGHSETIEVQIAHDDGNSTVRSESDMEQSVYALQDQQQFDKTELTKDDEKEVLEEKHDEQIQPDINESMQNRL